MVARTGSLWSLTRENTEGEVSIGEIGDSEFASDLESIVSGINAILPRSRCSWHHSYRLGDWDFD